MPADGEMMRCMIARPYLRSAGISVMQSADLWDGDDLFVGTWFDFSRIWRVAI